MVAYKGLRNKQWDIRFWRTRSGLEVDFILGNAEVAIEVKLNRAVQKRELKGLTCFLQDFPAARAIMVTLDPHPRKIQLDQGVIWVFPWTVFLEKLWNNEIMVD